MGGRETSARAGELRTGQLRNGELRNGTTPDPAGPLVWQRTDTVGTELAFRDADGRTTAGSAVIGGTGPHSVHWLAAIGTDGGVRGLRLTCESAQSRRTLTLTHQGDGTVVVQTRGAADDEPETTRLPGVEVVRVTDSPMFLTWAMRRLGLSPGAGAVPAVTARILLPSLTVATGTSTYQLVSDHRLRVAGDEAPIVIDLDENGIVTYCPGRLRLA